MRPVGAAGAVVTFSTELCADQFPAASRARTVIPYVVFATSPVTLMLVPVGVAYETPFLNTSYAVTPTLSVEALHESVNDARTERGQADR